MIDRFRPVFRGNGQHDSQDLVAFLLDGFHEDMNRVKEKPYIEERNVCKLQLVSKQGDCMSGK